MFIVIRYIKWDTVVGRRHRARHVIAGRAEKFRLKWIVFNIYNINFIKRLVAAASWYSWDDAKQYSEIENILIVVIMYIRL